MKNWKTTLLGIAVAVLNLYAGGVTIKTAALSVGLGLLGAAAKDSNVTGGSVVQPTPLAAQAQQALVDGAVVGAKASV